MNKLKYSIWFLHCFLHIDSSQHYTSIFMTNPLKYLVEPEVDEALCEGQVQSCVFCQTTSSCFGHFWLNDEGSIGLTDKQEHNQAMEGAPCGECSRWTGVIFWETTFHCHVELTIVIWHKDESHLTFPQLHYNEEIKTFSWQHFLNSWK